MKRSKRALPVHPHCFSADSEAVAHATSRFVRSVKPGHPSLGTSSATGELTRHAHCFSADSEAVARPVSVDPTSRATPPP